jgi:hypothetical protein
MDVNARHHHEHQTVCVKRREGGNSNEKAADGRFRPQAPYIANRMRTALPAATYVQNNRYGTAGGGVYTVKERPSQQAASEAENKRATRMVKQRHVASQNVLHVRAVTTVMP